MAQVLERPTSYVLGHSAEELRRLEEQGAVLRSFTERLLRDAGIGPGMRVLDAGCGNGEVSLLTAELVGPAGIVTGVDRSPEALTTAQARAAARGLQQVSFQEDDIATIADAAPFDAVIGRLVLAYQPDPAAVLRHLVGMVRPGGIVAFGEALLLSPGAIWPRRPLLERSVGWVVEAMRQSGAHINMGIRLHPTFVDAGLPTPHTRLDGVVFGGADPARPGMVAGIVRSFLPAIERFGLATAAEVDVETLLDRLLAEAAAIGGAGCGFLLGGAWARKPVA